MSEKLLPCPFCGSPAQYDFFSKGKFHRIKCSKISTLCPMPSLVLFNKKSVIKYWNTRMNTIGKKLNK